MTTTQIRVLGPGCFRCQALYENTLMAVDDLGLDAEVVKVEDLAEMLTRRVLGTPVLVVDDKVVMVGELPSSRKLSEFLGALLERPGA